MGATLIWPFAAIELAALGAAFLIYARHATDQECITLRQGRLTIEQECAGQTKRCEFARHAVQVDAPEDRDRLVVVRSGGTVVRVGRFLRAELRPVLVRELRLALKG